jgi:hypothetical protein
MPGFSSRGIFISYRREDAAPYARLLKFQLDAHFPDTHVFMDLDSIEPGLDFAEVIREAMDSCAVLVALIGRQWAALADEQGHRRLDNPDDFVRFEIQTALEHGARVIPVLVDGATPLRREQLPTELQTLARFNALELSYSRYDYDAGRLISVIQHRLAAVRDVEEADRETRQVAPSKIQQKAELTTLEERASAAGEAGDPVAARDQYAALLSMHEHVSGPEQPDTLTARRNLAYWTGQAGDAVAARDRHAALVPVYERVLGPQHPTTLNARNNLAYFTRKAKSKRTRS